MTQEELQAIRERADAATPGPWTLEGADVETPNGDAIVEYVYETVDREFIAHARTDIPALLDYIARLRERGHNLLAAIESAHEQGELSKAAMLRLNTPGAMMRRTIRREPPSA